MISCVVGTLLLVSIVSALDLCSQCLFAAVCFRLRCWCCARFPGAWRSSLVVLSLVASLRYMYWRLTSTLEF